MAFLHDALALGQTGLDKLAEDSPFATVADGAGMARSALDMAQNGADWKNGSELAGSGVKLGIDLLRDNEQAGLVESVIPGLGPLIGGAATTVGGLGGMYQHADQAGQGVFANDEGGRNEFWGSAGDATLGAMHAGLGATETLAIMADGGEAMTGVGLPLELLSLPATGVALAADTSLSTAETVVNGAGLLTGMAGSGLNMAQGLSGKDAHDWYFGAGDVVGGVEHAAVNGLSALNPFAHYAE
jgi:hypothetical protein